jgi:uncharacterized protein (TIGR03437 family)
VVNTALNQVDVYTTASNPPRLTNTVKTSLTPLAAAISRNGRSLYVACYGASSLDVVDLTGTSFAARTVSLPASPEAVAVGFDERVLISTIGTGTGASVLLTYDPAAASQSGLRNLAIAPAAPATPALPPPNGVMALASRARLLASPDGKTIVGVHGQAATRTVFVYDATASTVLRSRVLTGLSTVLAISADATQFLSGQVLLETASMLVLGQQNAANAPFTFPSGTNFAAQTTQGGAAWVKTSLGSAFAAAYNAAPVQTAGAGSNRTQLLFDAPDNLLVQLGLQIPESFSGVMVAASDSSALYAISQSGFTVLPLASLAQLPIALPDSNVALLSADPCASQAAQSTAAIPVRNIGGGRLTLTAQMLSATTTSASVRITSRTYGGDLNATFNPAAARSLGTSAPDQVLLQASEAVNIIPLVRIYQNYRNPETRGSILPVDTGASSTGLADLLTDTARRRLYIANPGLNRVEVFDLQRQQFLAPIPVGQLPRSMAFGPDGTSLYVANSGAETVSVIDLDKGVVSGRVNLPPIPFNASFAILTPQVMASSERGPQIVMSDGTLWKVSGSNLTPRPLNTNIFGSVRSMASPQSMAGTPDGAYVLVLSGTGAGFLYDAGIDDFVNARQIVATPITGNFGPIAAGPGGQYYLVNGLVLNAALTTSGFGSAGLRPVAAVAAAGSQSFVRFTSAVRSSSTAAAADAGLVELVEVSTERATLSAAALESPLATVAGTARVNVAGRTIAYDSTTNSAYVLTASGLSVVPLTPSTSRAPQFSPAGVVNTANLSTAIAPGGLVSIFGSNLASGSSSAASTPLPTILGGACVTLNNAPLPILAVSPTQINVQIPPTLAGGRYPLIVRSLDAQAASSSVTVTVSKYAPAVFLEAAGPAIFHKDGTRVDKNHPARRDEPLTIYATGLGVTTGGKVTAGMPSPSAPLAVTAPVKLYFGDPTITQTAVIVDWSGLKPDLIGVYQINCRVPGYHWSGDALPVTIRIGGADSPRTGPSAALVYVD